MVTTPLEMGDLFWGSRGFKLRGPGLLGRTPPRLNDGMLPCMQPGTIIAVATGVHATRFLAEVHPKIQVPYVVSGDHLDHTPRLALKNGCSEVLCSLLNHPA